MKLLLIHTKQNTQKSIKHNLKPRFQPLILFSVKPKAREAQKIKTPNSQDRGTNLQSFTERNQTFICKLDAATWKKQSNKTKIKNRNSQSSNLVSKIEQIKNHNSKKISQSKKQTQQLRIQGSNISL